MEETANWKGCGRKIFDLRQAYYPIICRSNWGKDEKNLSG